MYGVFKKENGKITLVAIHPEYEVVHDFVCSLENQEKYEISAIKKKVIKESPLAMEEIYLVSIGDKYIPARYLSKRTEGEELEIEKLQSCISLLLHFMDTDYFSDSELKKLSKSARILNKKWANIRNSKIDLDTLEIERKLDEQFRQII